MLKTLPAALTALARADAGVTSRADEILAIVKSAGIRDGAEFNKAVRAAYAANGWHQAGGRPGKGSRGQPIPATVKQYVSMVRRAFRLDLPVAGFKTFHALRKAIKEAGASSRKPPVRKDPRMAGLTLVKAGTLTGAPFHDLTVLYANASRQEKAKIASEVNGLVQKFRPTVAPVLELRKAA